MKKSSLSLLALLSLIFITPSLRAAEPAFALQWQSDVADMDAVDPGTSKHLSPKVLGQQVPVLHDENVSAEIFLVNSVQNPQAYFVQVYLTGDNSSRSDYVTYKIQSLQYAIHGFPEDILIAHVKKANLNLPKKELTITAELPSPPSANAPKELCEIKISFSTASRTADRIHFEYLQSGYQISYMNEKKPEPKIK